MVSFYMLLRVTVHASCATNNVRYRYARNIIKKSYHRSSELTNVSESVAVDR